MATVNVYAPLSFVFAPVQNTKSEGEKNRYVLVLHTTESALFGLAVTTNPVYGKARLAPGPGATKCRLSRHD